MERRLLLVFALTFLVIIAFQPLLKKFGPQPTGTPQPTEPQIQPAALSPTPVVSTPSLPSGVTRQAPIESETVIDNDLYRITFSNRGAQVKSWILKKFDNDEQEGPLELVHAIAAQKYGYPLSLWTYDESLRGKLNSVLYLSSHDGTHTAPADITFEYADRDLSIRKTFHFDHTYVLRLETSVTYKGSPVAALPAWPSGFGDQNTPASYAAALIDYQFNNNIERLPIKKISSGATINGPLHWAGPLNQYFAAIFIPDDPNSAAMVTLRNPIDNPQDAKHANEVVGAAVGNLHGPTVERVFVGPKALDVLESVQIPGITSTNPDLRGLVDFGWWGILARPLFLWLKWTYNHLVHNWGWAIILQTLIINITLLPLRIAQMKSMLKMQRVAPQIKSIQEKYKKYSLRDPRKAAMNEEVAALYKKEGVNPAGGCLPMLIQFPFLIAYYRMLGVALDLRHAHWLWIRDLSAPDPWRLLPIAVVLTMLIMQRMTPQVGMDPAQQKMMNLMMPVMFGVFSLSFAAGLSLYYSVGNLIGIAQQYVINRTDLGREIREIMEKRARKKEK